MKHFYRHITDRYLFRAIISCSMAMGVTLSVLNGNILWIIISSLLLLICLYWQWKLYRRHTKKVLFLLDAIENDDTSIHFSEKEDIADDQLINQALNRVASILYNVKNETIQQEKYYELILDCISTGILVLNDTGAVYQKNNEALRLLGLDVFTHIKQLAAIDTRLMEILTQCRSGDKLQTRLSNERGTLNLSIRVSNITVRREHLRILALNDINNELDEKEIDSWIRLIRVLTHEIMNSVTPITSLSDTLLTLIQDSEEQNIKGEHISSEKETAEEIRNGLHTISATGKGLLSFVENYRRFTRIPTPEPSLFYVKGFIDRMVELARYQYPDSHITFRINITPDDLILYADANLISQVLINILKNAIQAIEAGKVHEGIITLRAYCNESEAVLIEVSNNGPAIPEEIAEHIFIPFFTTKEGGSGVGLSISRQIMRLSGGSLSLHPGKETMFVLKFN
ncbi:sensor histidine kinase [Bacteroides sp. UBA939]|uniref:sensor histidine kinase n=1 Tax=Bacteroides sp. UBA939 TaxID=1946092 RepID=UPI0025BEA9F8|nr:ATP-binding protein [Bacteroides sp. UBA939]